MFGAFGRFYGEGEGGSGTETPPVTPPAGEIVFTPEQQAKVNALLAENKRTLQAKLADAEKKLNDAAKNGADVSLLKNQIKTLNDSLLTKEELAKQNEEALKQTFEQQLKEKSEAATFWEGNYKQSVFDREIGRAAAKHDAFDPDQLAVLLSGKSEVVSDTDKDGKPTGKFKVLTKIELEGKQLVLPIDEAVGKLRESGKYPNQFKVKGSPGTGITLNNTPNPIDHNDGTVPSDMNGFMKMWNNLPANIRKG